MPTKKKTKAKAKLKKRKKQARKMLGTGAAGRAAKKLQGREKRRKAYLESI